jgi:hypothetical protein
VRRLSAGIALATIVYRHFAQLAGNFLKEGDWGIFNEHAMKFSEIQGLFAERNLRNSTSAHHA